MRELRIASPEELACRLRPSVLGTWAALYAIDPWGEGRDDLRAGIIASTLANANRDSRKRPRPYAPHEFMPYYERAPEEPEALFERFSRDLAAAAPGNKVVKKAQRK